MWNVVLTESLASWLRRLVLAKRCRVVPGDGAAVEAPPASNPLSDGGGLVAVPATPPRPVEATKSTPVTELKCGDIFEFRGKTYLCLTNVLDDRTQMAVVVAVGLHVRENTPTVTVIRFFKHFKVRCAGRASPIRLEVLDNTREECEEALRREKAV